MLKNTGFSGEIAFSPHELAVSSYDGIHEILKSLSDMSVFDVIRIDHRWLSWFGEKVFLPLDNLDAGLNSTLEAFIPGLIPQYTNVGRSMYTLPEPPNSQLLFYRRDLFDNPAIQRLFKEQNKCELISYFVGLASGLFFCMMITSYSYLH